MSSLEEPQLPFYKHQVCRIRATQVLQECILQDRLNRSTGSRHRTETTSSYSIGMEVDVFKRTTRKDLSGWRGPAIITSISGEGTVCVKWQGTYQDFPPHLVRPHRAMLMKQLYIADDLKTALLHNSMFRTLANLTMQLSDGGQQHHYVDCQGLSLIHI